MINFIVIDTLIIVITTDIDFWVQKIIYFRCWTATLLFEISWIWSTHYVKHTIIRVIKNFLKRLGLKNENWNNRDSPSHVSNQKPMVGIHLVHIQYRRSSMTFEMSFWSFLRLLLHRTTYKLNSTLKKLLTLNHFSSSTLLLQIYV